MRGRDETTKVIEDKIKEDLKNDPQILTDYFYSMTDKTAYTKKMYVFYVRDYLNYCKENGINYVSATLIEINRYAQHIRFRKQNGSDDVVENSKSIQASRLYAVKSFYEFLIDGDLIEKNPCQRLKMPRVNDKKPIVAMNKTEIKSVKYAIRAYDGVPEKWKTRDLAIISIGCNTGLRVTSIVEINIEDIDLHNKMITVTEKGNKTRVVYFGDHTKESIIQWLDYRKEIMGNNNGPLFVSNRKKRISTDAIRHILEKYTAGIDKHITPHKMRSSCATNLYKETHDIYLVQDVLGHSNIDNTKRYADMSDANRRSAASVVDF